MSFFVLASVQQPPPVEPPQKSPRRWWLESWDGSRVLMLDNPWSLQAGSTGLDVAPTEVFTASMPGVAGSAAVDVVTLERPMVLVLNLFTNQLGEWGGFTEQMERLELLRQITDPTRGMTRDGNFRLVCESPWGIRRLNLAYQSGLEGDGQELPHFRRVALSVVAPQPFAEDQVAQSRTFEIVPSTDPFLGGLWGDIYLASSSVLGVGTPVQMYSAVPVWPTITMAGPADSVLLTGDNGLRVDVPAGLEPGDVLRIVTDPRARSIRLNGEVAASRLARGSRFAPFSEGETLVSVAAPGATSDTTLTLEWRGLHRSLS